MTRHRLKPGGALDSYAAIVHDYSSHYRPEKEHELEYFKTQASFRAALDKAGLAIGANGKRHPHQRRIPGKVLSMLRHSLVRNSDRIRPQRTFEGLHALLARQCGRIHGIGPLTVYDTALRLGAALGLEPTVIYLHAGTRKGAAALGLPTGKASSAREISRAHLPPVGPRRRRCAVYLQG